MVATLATGPVSESSIKTLWSASICPPSSILLGQLLTCVLQTCFGSPHLSQGSVVGRIWKGLYFPSASGWGLDNSFGQSSHSRVFLQCFLMKCQTQHTFETSSMGPSRPFDRESFNIVFLVGMHVLGNGATDKLFVVCWQDLQSQAS